jgi:hypothetical protein
MAPGSRAFMGGFMATAKVELLDMKLSRDGNNQIVQGDKS